mmetsp:Transcript_11532/g.33146  ORF Transcript_11532/g.33146 Transcript_11532/m.33146 type:complete len:210 (-) Transcript_11532:1012-1641(-)
MPREQRRRHFRLQPIDLPLRRVQWEFVAQRSLEVRHREHGMVMHSRIVRPVIGIATVSQYRAVGEYQRCGRHVPFREGPGAVKALRLRQRRSQQQARSVRRVRWQPVVQRHVRLRFRREAVERDLRQGRASVGAILPRMGHGRDPCVHSGRVRWRRTQGRLLCLRFEHVHVEADAEFGHGAVTQVLPFVQPVRQQDVPVRRILGMPEAG